MFLRCSGVISTRERKRKVFVTLQSDFIVKKLDFMRFLRFGDLLHWKYSLKATQSLKKRDFAECLLTFGVSENVFHGLSCRNVYMFEVPTDHIYPKNKTGSRHHALFVFYF